MEQFNLKIWLQDKSRKVVTREGKDVVIIYTNSPVPYHPIIGFIDKSIYTWTIDGKLIYGKKEQDKNDLFFADEKDKLTEFENMLRYVLECYSGHEFASESEIETLKLNAKSLLDLARKELQPEFDNEIDKMLAKTDKVVYQKGQQDVLKDLPKWKKITEEEQNYLAYGCLSHDGYYLSIQELKDKLPKEE